MDRKELIIFGLFTILALFVLFKTMTQPEPEIIILQQPSTPVMQPAGPIEDLPPAQPEVLPEPVAVIPEEAPFPVPELPPVETGPSKQELMPYYVEFTVNKIIIPQYFSYFMPIRDDKIKTYSGKFGPYAQDYSKDLYVELCKSPRGFPESIACEKVRDLYYTNNYLGFVRGYPPDEYLANVAMKDFNAYYLIISKEHGTLAKSNVAPVRIVAS